MTTPNPTATDDPGAVTLDLGQRVLHMIAEGYDGAQILRLGCTIDQAETALHAYAARILHDGTHPWRW